MRISPRWRWLFAWGIQIVEMLLVCLIVSAAYGVHPPVLYTVSAWIVTPLFGAYTAFRAVLRGLSNYAAWIAPPACMFAAHCIVWGFSPSPGPALLCAFVSLIGAATGEVLKQRRQNK